MSHHIYMSHPQSFVLRERRAAGSSSINRSPLALVADAYKALRALEPPRNFLERDRGIAEQRLGRRQIFLSVITMYPALPSKVMPFPSLVRRDPGL
jgi:hypothetical protein